MKDMKKYYEIALMQHVHGSVEDDYESVDYITWYKTYWEYRKVAKELSKHYGKIDVPGCGFKKFKATEPNKEFHSQGLDEGLAMVKIVCYTETDTSYYQPLYYEYYNNGKVDYKIKFDE